MTTLVARAGNTSVRLAVRRPAFEDLWEAYAEVGRLRAADVYERVGGRVADLYRENPTDYANACALRMSRGFNYGGYAIPSGTIIPGRNIYRVRGGDEKAYILRVNDMIQYVKHNWGNADLTLSPSQAGQLAGRKGLIVMEVSGWRDATGHVTLWDGARSGDGSTYHDPRSDNYGSGVSLTRILYWELK